METKKVSLVEELERRCAMLELGKVARQAMSFGGEQVKPTREIIYRYSSEGMFEAEAATEQEINLPVSLWQYDKMLAQALREMFPEALIVIERDGQVPPHSIVDGESWTTECAVVEEVANKIHAGYDWIRYD